MRADSNVSLITMPPKMLPADIFGATKAGWVHMTDTKAASKAEQKKFQPRWVLLWRVPHAERAEAYQLNYYKEADR